MGRDGRGTHMHDTAQGPFGVNISVAAAVWFMLCEACGAGYETYTHLAIEKNCKKRTVKSQTLPLKLKPRLKLDSPELKPVKNQNKH